MKTLATRAIAMLAGVVALTGCSSSSKPGSSSGAAESVVHLSLWGGFTGPDRPGYEGIVKSFNDSHPSIKVSMDIEPWDSIRQKLPQAWATGQGPDIAATADPGSIFNYIKTNSIIPLDDAVGTGADKINSSAFPPSVRQTYTVGGKLYAVPANVATLALYYNKTLFAKAGIATPPTTQAELIADAKKLTGNGIYGLSLGDHATIQMWPVLQWMNGGDILDAKGCAAIQQPASVQALQIWANLVAKDHISPVGQDGGAADTLFSAQKAAMELNGPWAAAGFRKAGVDLGIAVVPRGAAGPADLLSTLPLMVAKDSKHQAAAKQFLAYYTGKTAQAAFSKTTGFPPVRTDLTNAPNSNADVHFFAAALPYAKTYFGGQPAATQLDTDVYVPLIGQIQRGGDVQAAADSAAKAMNQLTGCKG